MSFYKQAALALDHLDSKQGSVKGSLAAAGLNGNEKEGKRVLALVIETLKYKPTLLTISSSISLLKTERKVFPSSPPAGAPTSPNLLLVLLHDLLISKESKIHASDKWPPKAAVMKHATRLKAEVVRETIRRGLKGKDGLERGGGDVGASIPRYARCNTNVTTLSSLISRLTAPPHSFILSPTPTYPPEPKTFFLDPHLSDVLLAFPPATRFEHDQDYLSGGLVLQDKASCFPAKVLMVDWKDGEGEVLDATAAPGNKTSYMSALMGNKGKLHAFERSHNRFKTLQKMLSTAQCKNVEPVRADFTHSDPKDFSNVTRILLDPSCSGSGIVNRLDYLLEGDEAENDEQKQERLDKLASFQLSMIQHAMTFPSAKRIVYSTCSIHKEEDEDVVMQALASAQAKSGNWTLAPRSEVLPSWERRGMADHMGSHEMADSVIRCSPAEDHTNGFFVSCFIKVAQNTLAKRKTEDSSHFTSKKLKRDNKDNEGEEEGEGLDDVADVHTSQVAADETQFSNDKNMKKKSQKKKKKKKAKAF